MTNKILIITNEPADAQALQRILGHTSDGPFSSEWVSRLDLALARLSKRNIDAILVDLTLPDSSGLATFDSLFAAVPGTPILTLSTVEDDVLSTQAVKHGSQGYLAKGYFSSNLVPQSLRSMIQRKAVEEALIQEKAWAELVLNAIGDAVICTDLAGNLTYMNLAAQSMTGWSRDEAEGHPIGDVFHIMNGATRQRDQNPVALVLETDAKMGLNEGTILIRRDGTEAAIADSTAPIHDRDGHVTGAVIVFHDVSAARAMTKKMTHLAQHDFLTSLPNRVLLNDRIARTIAYARRHETPAAILFLDLDDFKQINDTLGHDVGDKLLQSVSKRLVGWVRDTDTVSRLGGDEFVILLGESTDDDAIALTAGKILTALAAEHTIDRNTLHVSASIGISLYPKDGDTPQTLLKNADTAMYYAKESGRNNYQFFSKDMNSHKIKRKHLANVNDGAK